MILDTGTAKTFPVFTLGETDGGIVETVLLTGVFASGLTDRLVVELDLVLEHRVRLSDTSDFFPSRSGRWDKVPGRVGDQATVGSSLAGKTWSEIASGTSGLGSGAPKRTATR